MNRLHEASNGSITQHWLNRDCKPIFLKRWDVIWDVKHRTYGADKRISYNGTVEKVMVSSCLPDKK